MCKRYLIVENCAIQLGRLCLQTKQICRFQRHNSIVNCYLNDDSCASCCFFFGIRQVTRAISINDLVVKTGFPMLNNCSCRRKYPSFSPRSGAFQSSRTSEAQC